MLFSIHSRTRNYTFGTHLLRISLYSVLSICFWAKNGRSACFTSSTTLSWKPCIPKYTVINGKHHTSMLSPKALHSLSCASNWKVYYIVHYAANIVMYINNTPAIKYSHYWFEWINIIIVVWVSQIINKNNIHQQ